MKAIQRIAAQEKPLGILEQLQEENHLLKRELQDFKQEVRLWMEDLGDDVKGNKAAAAFLSIGVTTLCEIRNKAEYGIKPRYEGKTPVYSRKALVAYKMRYKKRKV